MRPRAAGDEAGRLIDSAGASTDFSGNFAYDYALASDAATGTYTVDVLGAGDAVLATTTFSVEAGGGALCSKLGTEAVATDKTAYYAGNTVALSGSGYSHLCDVAIEIAGPDTTVLARVNAPTGIGGTFNSTYTLPAGAAAGDYTVTTLGLADVELATASFRVAQLGEAFIKTEVADYSPGKPVTVIGGCWQPGETVSILFHSSLTRPDTTVTSVADANGDFTNSNFILAAEDEGASYTVTATGQSSGKTAETTFTDTATTDCFRSVASGNWNANTTWETAAPSGGICPSSGYVAANATPSSSATKVTIQSGHTVTVTANATVNDMHVLGTLTINFSVSTITLTTGAGSPAVTVSGTVNVNGGFSLSSGSGSPSLAVSGTFNVLTGGTFTPASNSSSTVNSGGTLAISSGATVNGGGQNASLTVAAGGTVTSASAIPSFGQITDNGTLTSSANVSLPSISGLQVGGTLTMTAGTLTVSRGSSGTTGNINNNGTIALQGSSVFAIAGNAGATFHVASGGTLDMGPSALVNGVGFLTVDSGGNLKIGSTDGIAASTTIGNVRTSSATADSYSTGANYDNAKVMGYNLYRNGVLLATITPGTRNYTDKNAPSGTDSYWVVAFDAAGNSTASNTVSLTFP